MIHLAEERGHVVHGVVCDRLLAVVQSIVWPQHHVHRGCPEWEGVPLVEHGLVHDKAVDDDAGCAHPHVQVGRHPTKQVQEAH